MPWNQNGLLTTFVTWRRQVWAQTRVQPRLDLVGNALTIPRTVTLERSPLVLAPYYYYLNLPIHLLSEKYDDSFGNTRIITY